MQQGPAGSSGPAHLAALVSCVLRAERAQVGLPSDVNPAVSRMVDAALGRFVGLPYLAEHRPQSARRAEQLAAQSIVSSFCRGSGPGTAHDGWAFAYRAVPPALTPLEIAKLMARTLQAPGAVARAPGAVFGVAARPGLLFEHGDLHGASFGTIAVTCA